MKNGKSKPDRPEQLRVSELQLEQDDLVIFDEDLKFRFVPKTYYSDPEQRLPDKYRSAAEFVVGLGAVVADITSYQKAQLDGAAQALLTADCACIVLNLAAIRQESEKRRGPYTELQNGHPEATRTDSHENENTPGLKVEKDDLVVFGEDGKFYLVKKEYYTQEKQVLPDDMKSAPQLMVELGAVVADIPRLPTAGSACQLVNLASIRQGSEQVARRIREQKQAALEQKQTESVEVPRRRVRVPAKPSEHRVQARRGYSGPRRPRHRRGNIK